MMIIHSPGSTGGPLPTYMQGYREALNALGYAELSIGQLTALARRLDQWLQCKGLGAATLDEREVQLFLNGLFRNKGVTS